MSVLPSEASALLRKSAPSSMEQGESAGGDGQATVVAQQQQQKNRLYTLVAVVVLACLAFVAVVTTTSMRPKNPSVVLNLSKKTVLTHVGEMGQTPPPSPTTITYTYHPTFGPTQEDELMTEFSTTLSTTDLSDATTSIGEARAAKLAEKQATRRAKKTLTVEEEEEEEEEGGEDGTLDAVGTTGSDETKQHLQTQEKGNTPPPSPSVILYTYHPTAKPQEESSETDYVVGEDTDTSPTDVIDLTTSTASSNRRAAKAAQRRTLKRALKKDKDKVEDEEADEEETVVVEATTVQEEEVTKVVDRADEGSVETINYHKEVIETGNTPPPSPSVILYTYQPTPKPQEEEVSPEDEVEEVEDVEEEKVEQTPEQLENGLPDNQVDKVPQRRQLKNVFNPVRNGVR